MRTVGKTEPLICPQGLVDLSRLVTIKMFKKTELTGLGGSGFNGLSEDPKTHFRASRQREFIQRVWFQAFDCIGPGRVEGDVDLKSKYAL